jgi:hypothetical protein
MIASCETGYAAMLRRPANETVQVNLRIKESFRRRLEQSAEKAGVSLNAEMVHRLEESYRREDLVAVLKRHQLQAQTPLTLRASEQEKFDPRIIDIIKTAAQTGAREALRLMSVRKRKG